MDPARSSIGFTARHLLVSKVHGTFTRVAGTVEVAEDPRGSSVRAMADASSLVTGDTARDEHLRSEDFFDVERWPTLTLVGSGLDERDGRYVLEADLTIRDVTRPVSFEVSATVLDLPAAAAGSGRAARPAARFTAGATVNRKDFDLRWNAAIETGGVVVGDMVELTIVAVAELQA